MQIINIIAIVAIFIGTVFVAWKEGINDAENKKKINHKKDFRIRVAVGLCSSIIFNIITMWKYGAVGIIVATVFFLLSQAFIYWILFELSFNLHDKRDPLSVGTTAKLDKAKNKLGISDIAYLILKIAGFGICFAIYILWCFGDHWTI